VQGGALLQRRVPEGGLEVAPQGQLQGAAGGLHSRSRTGSSKSTHPVHVE
jgi:hypothetical protein